MGRGSNLLTAIRSRFQFKEFKNLRARKLFSWSAAIFPGAFFNTFSGAQIVIKKGTEFVPPKLTQFLPPKLVVELKNGGQNLIDFLGQILINFWGHKFGFYLKTIHKPDFYPRG